MRTLHLLFLFCILLSYTFAEEEDLIVDNEEEFDQDEIIENDANNFEPPHSGGNQEEQQESQRQIIISCILLTKQYIHSQSKELKETLDTHDKDQSGQMSAYRKILGRLLNVCYKNLNIESAVKFLGDMRNNDLKLENYLNVLSEFKWEQYALTSGTQVDLKLSSDEENLLHFMEEFEKAMKDRQDKQEEEQEQFKKVSPDDYEPKIAGLSMKNTPKSLQLIYLIGIISIFGGIIIYGLMQVMKPKQMLGDKKNRRKAKKE